jgi:hypothetical protein
MNVSFAKPEERAEVLEWVRAQEGHEDWNFLEWSNVMVARDDDGTIRGVCEMAAFQTAEYILDVSRPGLATHRTFTKMNEHLDGLGIRPVIIASKDADLTRYARKILKPAFEGFEFFRR